jgi:hypothetical protein
VESEEEDWIMVRILAVCTFVTILALGTAHASLQGNGGFSGSGDVFGIDWSDLQSDPGALTSDLSQTWLGGSEGGNQWDDGGSVWKDDSGRKVGSHPDNHGDNFWGGTSGGHSWGPGAGSSDHDRWWSSQSGSGDHGWWWSPEHGYGDHDWWWHGFPHEPGYPWGWYGNHGHQGVGVSSPLPSALLFFGPALAALAALRRKRMR